MITLERNAPISCDQLNTLFAASWPDHQPRDFGAVHARSLAWISAWRGGVLIGYVNVATNGGLHAFLLDTTVHPDERSNGLGRRLVSDAAEAARQRGAEWLHVDHTQDLLPFYRACGFRPTTAGLLRLS